MGDDALRIVGNDDKRLIPWAEDKIGVCLRPDARAIGQYRGDELCAVVVFDSFSRCDCNIHIASDGSKRWMTRALALETFHYPFVTLNLRRITGLVPAKNEAALRYDLKLGFRYEGRLAHALPDDDIIILGMLRKHCRFIRPEYRHA